MQAVICQHGELTTSDLAEPTPGPGQVVLEVLRCGICGSDLHARHHCNHWGEIMGRSGYRQFMRADQPIVLGHEFCGAVLDHGPGCKRSQRPGTVVCAVPIRRHADAIDMIGFSETSPGAYAERILVDEAMLMPVPNGLSPDLAALAEPMAVGWHAVARGQVKSGDVAVVIGCGPVGLAIIAILKGRGVKTVVACDLSPGRRDLAKKIGADVVIDPRQESPYADSAQRGHLTELSQLFELGMATRERLGKLPLPWWQTWRLAEALGLKPKAPVIFECVGAKGVLQHIIDGAPLFARVVVVGVCMGTDTIEPCMAINKEVDLRFVLGYSPLEYRDALHAIAHGTVRCEALITGHVSLNGVATAFAALGDPNQHAKILIDPKRLETTVTPYG